MTYKRYIQWDLTSMQGVVYACLYMKTRKRRTVTDCRKAENYVIAGQGGVSMPGA